MVVGVDAGCLGINDKRLKVGVYRMSFSLLNHLFRIDKKNFYRLYSFFPIEENLLKLFGRRIENRVLRPVVGWLKIWLPLELRRNPVDVFIGLSQSLPSLPKKTKGIVFVHDLTFEKNPYWFINSYIKMSSNTKYAVKKADWVIAISQSTKNDLMGIYGVPAKKIAVIYEGCEDRLLKVNYNSSDLKIKFASLNISKPYLLFVGTFKQSKNIPNLLRAFSIFLKKRGSQKNFQLVLVGSDYWLDKEISLTLQKLKLEEDVRLLGFVDDDILSMLYKKALMFISPAFNEGFGLTYLEACTFDLPIIASDRGAVKEVLGEAAFYVDPSDPRDIARSIEFVLNNNRVCQEKIRLAKQIIKRFSWYKSASQLYEYIMK